MSKSSVFRSIVIVLVVTNSGNTADHKIYGKNFCITIPDGVQVARNDAQELLVCFQFKKPCVFENGAVPGDGEVYFELGLLQEFGSDSSQRERWRGAGVGSGAGIGAGTGSGRTASIAAAGAATISPVTGPNKRPSAA